MRVIGPVGLSWADATPQAPPVSPTPSGCRVAGAPCRILANWSPGSAPSGSCGGVPHWPCRALIIQTTETDPILLALNCAPTPVCPGEDRRTTNCAGIAVAYG